MNRLFTPFPSYIAVNRLKSNAFILVLTFLVRTLFTPYTSLRRGIIRLFNSSWIANIIWGAESLATFVLMWNIVEAGYSAYFPTSTPTTTMPPASGMTMTPTKISSPLTRAYPSPTPLTPNSPTPTPTATSYPTSQSSLQKRYSTPTRTASPLSASTSKLLNLPPPTPPSSTGLFYNPEWTSSPAKVGAPPPQNQNQAQTQDGSGSTGGDFVLIDRDEREWVDNVWKGVRGKGGRLGL